MKYCKKCVLPESHESIVFDEDGVCNICKQSEVKHERIDWNERRKTLDNIVSFYRDKGQYDCIVPYSGGKDSVYQLWFIIKELGLKPLVVRYNHWGYRPIVEKNNNKVFKKLGVDVLEFRSSWKVVKMLMLASLQNTGDFCWHCHTGVFAHTMQIAVIHDIPLVIWGESSSEYRSYRTAEEVEEFDESIFNQAVNLGINADKMFELLKGEVSRRDLETFEFPSKEELQRVGVRAIYLGNYIKWHTKKNVETIKRELNWEGIQVEGIPPEYDYEKIECRWQGVRDYCKYIKRGHGRTNHLVCIDIRNGELDREVGLRMVEKYDGKRPTSLDGFLRTFDITEDEFENMLLDTAVINWGFDRKDIKTGEELPDMKLWDTVV
ncbi:MAG: N-acetyl sugar amidotransferase [Oscillospiraceae bacterium]|jgi:N-acetyl sugar amidotransferase|nr:N-acetyl sugar amidotransferase [Oscillospiraceae bacterium]